ncbi:HAD-superfamily subfamily IIA hydrolase [Ketogulonicigenium robustum]|uniref:HAD-superfamily subfamily IIA hydrolase n=1 Tax=Ketogulonicigenium robustum TaxID=92947 RepID=A0A1W6NXV0_9RHOB|nr:TIGR01459 family HAD-type hydrolase [Ketogulonicigenium robustum]ARO14076.1 HAD-superfamily subfamily IIA hydrolase [Ketogulonicigenium robustum]
MSRIIETFDEIALNYDAAFVDLWGCMHDGVHALPAAVAAMQAYRAKGGTVVLVTNSPRPRASVEKQITEDFGIARDAWDAIATSGDAARTALFTGVVGQKVWFIGQPHERMFLQPPQVLDNPMEVTEVTLEDADGIVCAGPANPTADPDIYRPDFEKAIAKGLKLLCANPDIVVDRGESREWCAGKLAQIYTEMGGESLYFGKPHAPIYALARRRLEKLGLKVDHNRIICIGDGIITDVQGAVSEDYDCLYISGGLAARETKTVHQPDPQALHDYLAGSGLSPTYTIGFLR